MIVIFFYAIERVVEVGEKEEEGSLDVMKVVKYNFETIYLITFLLFAIPSQLDVRDCFYYWFLSSISVFPSFLNSITKDTALSVNNYMQFIFREKFLKNQMGNINEIYYHRWVNKDEDFVNHRGWAQESNERMMGLYLWPVCCSG